MILLCSQDPKKHWLFLSKFPGFYSQQKKELWRIIVGTCISYNKKPLTPRGQKYRTSTWKNPSIEDEVFTHSRQHLKQYVNLYTAEFKEEPEYLVNKGEIDATLKQIEYIKFEEPLNHFIYDERAYTLKEIRGADYEYISFFYVLKRAKVKSELEDIISWGIKTLDLDFLAIKPLLQKVASRCR